MTRTKRNSFPTPMFEKQLEALAHDLQMFQVHGELRLEMGTVMVYARRGRLMLYHSGLVTYLSPHRFQGTPHVVAVRGDAIFLGTHEGVVYRYSEQGIISTQIDNYVKLIVTGDNILVETKETVITLSPDDLNQISEVVRPDPNVWIQPAEPNQRNSLIESRITSEYTPKLSVFDTSNLGDRCTQRCGEYYTTIAKGHLVVCDQYGNYLGSELIGDPAACQIHVYSHLGCAVFDKKIIFLHNNIQWIEANGIIDAENYYNGAILDDGQLAICSQQRNDHLHVSCTKITQVDSRIEKILQGKQFLYYYNERIIRLMETDESHSQLTILHERVPQFDKEISRIMIGIVRQIGRFIVMKSSNDNAISILDCLRLDLKTLQFDRYSLNQKNLTSLQYLQKLFNDPANDQLEYEIEKKSNMYKYCYQHSRESSHGLFLAIQKISQNNRDLRLTFSKSIQDNRRRSRIAGQTIQGAQLCSNNINNELEHAVK